jgi:alkaline phosphatase
VHDAVAGTIIAVMEPNCRTKSWCGCRGACEIAVRRPAAWAAAVRGLAGLAVIAWGWGGAAAAHGQTAFSELRTRREQVPAAPAVSDPIRQMQAAAEDSGSAPWGYWGDQPGRYVSWSNHSNRLIPVYAFGVPKTPIGGEHSVYRDAERLAALYGRLPDHTLNPTASYFDQTDVHRLQLAAADAGKKHIVLVVFDGLDWTMTRTAAIATRGQVEYDSGRGTGFAFQDYRGCPTSFGLCVTSPANDGTKVDVDAQAILNPGGETPGGYDASRGGDTAWASRAIPLYLMGKDRDCPHAVTDSAASATSLCSGRKTYNDSINVGPDGTQLESIAHTLQARGFAVGAVSSVPVSHATPACSYAHNVHRGDYQDISRDLLGEPSVSHPVPLAGLDLLIGAGYCVRVEADADQGRNFEPGNKYVADSTVAAIDAAAGGRYRVAVRTPGRRGGDVLTEAAADAADRGLRLFGFFGTAQGNLPFRTANGDFDPGAGSPQGSEDPASEALRKKYGSQIHYSQADVEENPSLAEMTTVALDHLARRERFWLLVEAGDVDWGCHANNVDTAIGAVQSGDAAFRAIVDWVERHDAWDDTAVIVTSDHGHMFVLTEPAAFAAAGSQQ